MTGSHMAENDDKLIENEPQAADVPEAPAPAAGVTAATAEASEAKAASSAAVGATPAAGSAKPAAHKPHAPKPRMAGAPAARHHKAGEEEKPADPDKNQAAKGAKFIGLVFAAYVAFLFFSGQIDSFVQAFQNVEASWLVGAVVCIVMYFMLGTLAYVTAVYLDPESPVGFRDLMAVEASGTFFGNLTPMQMGALPSQIYQLTKAGLSVGEASATQFTRFIMFQLGVVLFAALMLFAKLGFFMSSYGDIVLLNLLVFAGHALELVFLFVVCLCPNFVRRVGSSLLRWANGHGWVKNYDKWDDMINVQVAQFSNAFMRSASNIPDMVLTLVITMVQLFFLYTIPWFVLHAFGVKGDFLTCLAAGSMVQLVSTAVPLPGGTGGAEGGFALFFGPMFGSFATAGFLVWRVITFFLPTFGALPLLGLKSSHKESIYHRVQRWTGRSKKSSGKKPARKTSGGVTVNPAKVSKSGTKFVVKKTTHTTTKK